MNSRTYKLGATKIEVLTYGDTFVGIGAVTIDGHAVRSGRLPIRPATKSETRLEVRDIVHSAGELRIRLNAEIAEIDMVIRAATDVFNGEALTGFSYHYEYRSETTPISWLLDSATWEFDGNVSESTVVTSSENGAPSVTFAKDTAWRSEGFLFSPDQDRFNFNFQWKAWRALVGFYERADVIYSTTRRDAGQPELLVTDKHIFDETKAYTTAVKKILLADALPTLAEARKLWLAVYEDCSQRARAEEAAV